LAHPAHAAPRIASACALIVALGLAACGSDSPSSSTAGQAQQQAPDNGRRGFFLQDPKVRACLKKQGVTAKLRAALQKCGVTFPNGGGPPPGQGTGTTTSSAS
jgi:hypothetical protein